MGLLNKIAGSPEARKNHRAAKANLAEVSRGITEETDEFVAANDAVVDAERQLPKWRRHSN